MREFSGAFERTLVEETLVKQSYCLAGLERDKFDNKTVSFEEHIKSEHNMWHYLYFLVLVRVKDPTEYTGPESYVAQMIAVSTTPVLKILNYNLRLLCLSFCFTHPGEYGFV